jgi:hypothetical protein
MQRRVKRVNKLSITELRRLAKQAAVKVTLLDEAENRKQDAVDLAAKELALYASAIEYKKAIKKNKKFSY